MLNLLRSDLSRLFRLTSFWGFVIITATMNIMSNATTNVEFDIFEELEFLCAGLMIQGAVIIGNLIGSDYTHGTIRNKTIAGHSRAEIFFSNWITSFICMIILTVESYSLTVIAGLMFKGTYTTDTTTTMTFLGLTMLFLLVCTAFFTFLYMTVFSQSASMTAGVIAAGFVIIATAAAISDLIEPKYIDAETAQTMISYDIPVEQDPEDPTRYLNPNYSDEGSATSRRIDVLSPISHIIAPRDERLPANIAAMCTEFIVFTAVGFIIFRRRDVK